MINIRKPIKPSIRFKILQRDGFSCRYCGRNGERDSVILHIDHLFPVSQGGSNDINNLVTSCRDCNLGKSDNLIEAVKPTAAQKSEVLHELNKQVLAAYQQRAAIKAREERKQETINFWCEQTGRDQVDTRTIGIIYGYVERHGEENVFPWIEAAVRACFAHDQRMGKYISGCCRNYEQREWDFSGGLNGRNYRKLPDR